MKMQYRTRPIMKRVMFSQEEVNLLQEKIEASGMRTFSRYARKMLLDGAIIHVDLQDLRELSHELAALGRSINQIALRANETRSIYAQDVEDLRQYYAEVKRACTERLVKMAGDDL